MKRTFRQRFLLGETSFDEIFDLTDAWNLNEEPGSLRDYLGLTEEEEDVWVSESDEALEELMNREKNRKVFFTDLDGTLLTDQKDISPKTLEALRKMTDQGNLIVLSSGRALRSVLAVAKEQSVPMKNSYAICYNGAEIYDMEAQTPVFISRLPRDLVELCFRLAKEDHIHIQAYLGDDVVAEQKTPELSRYCTAQALPARVVPDLMEALTVEPPKLLAIDYDDPAHVVAFREKLQEAAGDRLSLVQSNPYFLEVMCQGIDKGAAVTRLCEDMCIPIAHAVAAGDAENDLEMIKAAGVGVAMRNATDPVKQAADYVTTLDNNHDGIVELLEKFIIQ